MILPARHIPKAAMGRLLILRARGQRMATSAALIGTLALLFGVLRQWASFAPEGGWGDWEITKQFALLQVIPALIAGVIGMSVWSPLGESERTAAIPHWHLRLSQVVVLMGLALALALPLLAGWESRSPDIELSAVLIRNLVGLVGVALLCACAFDARWSWVGPISCATVAIVSRLFRVPPEKLWQGEWLVAGQHNTLSWIISAGLLAVGMAAYLRFGPRDTEGEAD